MAKWIDRLLWQNELIGCYGKRIDRLAGQNRLRLIQWQNKMD